ncbi:MAG: hypothetical protein Q7U36_02000 [bacterium]|nr:hypothetical protein [bacterium]
MNFSNQFLEKSQDAIRHYDDVVAKKLIKELESFLMSPDIQKNNPPLFQQLQRLLIHLKIVAIPQLSDEEVVNVFRNYYLESYRIEIDMENRLTVKLFSVPEIPRDELREKLKRALMENQQKLGLLTVSQWLTEFEKNYNVKTRNLSACVDFVNTNRNATTLNPIEKSQLKELIHTYDYLLITTLPATGPVLDEILSFSPSEAELSQNNLSPQPQTLHNYIPQEYNPYNQQEQSRIEQLSLSDALKKFPELGEQLITSMRIKLKNFPEPVRPSINNWLSDYTFSLGFESHSAMDRGTYLFRNENAKVLNSTDREKISFLLKAYDENSLVDVNVNTKQIVFPKHETRINEQGTIINNPQFQAPQRNIQEVYNFQKQETKPNDIFKEERLATENRNAGNINFSSPQKLPYEKQTIQPQPIQQPQKPVPSPQPMRISSQNLRNSNVPPGNIVNLKDQ